VWLTVIVFLDCFLSLLPTLHLANLEIDGGHRGVTSYVADDIVLPVDCRTCKEQVQNWLIGVYGMSCVE
jgi:hypothetical protein